MPIVNGTYVTQPLGSPKDVQNQVFGEYSRRDMSDYSQAAYNYLMQQQQQAFELDMWNLKNQYDSPAEQMKRFQDAGLNPNLIYGQQNVSGNVPQGSSAQFRSSGTFSRNTQQALGTISQIMNIVKTARDTYDYMQYGREQRAWDIALTRNQGEASSLRNSWERWLLGLSGDNSIEPTAPKRQMWQSQQNIADQRYKQLVALCGLIPDQQARLRALKALDDKRYEIMSSQNDAILNINTGHPILDQWLRMLSYFVMSKV